MMVQVSLNLGWAILNAAGPVVHRPRRPAARRRSGASWSPRAPRFIVSGEWWIALFPGAALMLAVFCFNLLGDGLRDIIDPRGAT